MGIGREIFKFAVENGYENEVLVLAILLIVMLIILANKFKDKEK